MYFVDFFLVKNICSITHSFSVNQLNITIKVRGMALSSIITTELILIAWKVFDHDMMIKLDDSLLSERVSFYHF